MKTAQAVNAPQIGHYEFRPNRGTVTMIGGPDNARDTLTSMFEACGWKVKFRKKKKRKRKPYVPPISGLDIV